MRDRAPASKPDHRDAARQAAFRRALNHSRRVRILKLALPAAALAIAAGFSFYVLCMVLPLVGPAGSRVPHAARNRATFLMVLLITLVLAGASTYVALQRRIPVRNTGTGRLAGIA